ncbi:hypothetical protein SeLEV6574_g04749 [Synchytrium endobioticum]|uniref:PRELI/MSF1 domain-containing protein n=1 Tax=Synchytrium endobioticum TaxID=286115 RepID=A0A507CY43_9FUNG|nr:hypothetical protein SeLEV6574_g04749 [Synchytrium endobioticum]
MVRFHHQPFTYTSPWETVTSAVWQKYPNPLASHVLTADVIERTVDPDTGILHTTRLFTKAGNMPKWGQSLFNIAPMAYIIEHSTVDPTTKIMTTHTRNLSHTKLMLVVETQRIRPHPDKHHEWTIADTKASVISNTAFAPLRGRVEEFGVSRFKENCIKSSQGLLRVIQRLTGKTDSTVFE